MRKKRKSELIEWIKSFAIALSIVLFVKFFVFDIIPIENVSMQPTLYGGDRVFLDMIAYKFSTPKRSDVVIFTPPVDKDSYYIKRVIGIPGDIISIHDGSVFINGRRLDEPYLPAGTITNGDLSASIPKGFVFVMGDNREDSSDSRDFGPISLKSVKGHALFMVFPFTRAGKL